MSQFRFDSLAISRLSRLIAVLRSLASTADSRWVSAMKDVADIARREYLKQFESEGAAFGKRWAALAAFTKADRARKGFPAAGPILVRRGLLKDSVTNPRSSNSRTVVTRSGVTLESTLRTRSGTSLYMLHQRGGKNLPERKISRDGSPAFISRSGWKEVEGRIMKIPETAATKIRSV